MKTTNGRTGHPFSEDEIIGACALRVDGYKYRDDTGFDPDGILDNFFSEGKWKATEVELLATFALLQRSLRWNMEYEPKEGRYYRAYVELFLKACRFDVPERYRHESGYDKWRRDFEPHLEKLVKLVQKTHKDRCYDDSLTVGSGMFRQSSVKPPERTAEREPEEQMGSVVRLSRETVQELLRKGIIKVAE